MFVSEQNKFIFFHIPKTAGTSIHRSLKASFDQYHLDPLPPVHHIQPKEYLYFNENKKHFFKFCFVRNPYERIVSAFLDFQNQRNTSMYYNFQILFDYYKINPLTTRTVYFMTGKNIEKENFTNFNEYCEALVKTNRENKDLLTISKSMNFTDFVKSPTFYDWVVDVHFKPQSNFILDDNGERLVDFIGRYEDLENDLTEISSKLNCEFKLEHIRESQKYQYQDFYDKKTKQIIGEVFKEDLELLNYGF
jgi:hypothetical protein